MTEPFNLTITEASRQIRKRQLSPVTLAESLLQRIQELEPTLKAWVTMDKEGVLAQARQAEGELEQRGPKDLLHGIPLGVKDIFYTAGMKTTACSAIYSDFVPAYDATSVAKFKKAGALVLGKTVTTEFAAGDPSPTRNPWNPAHTPGGSSSGSGAAVAARMCPGATGSQTVGSILRPAAYNGVVGLKATYGRISRYGVIPLSWSLDHVGIIVRSVEDAALMLQVMAGHDSQDPSSSNRAVPDYLGALDRLDTAPRIGLVRGFFFDHADEETRRHTEEVAQRLAQAGAQIEEVALPESFAHIRMAYSIIMRVESAAFHDELFRSRREEYGPKIRSTIEAGMLIPAVEYMQAQRWRRRFRLDMEKVIQPLNALLTPATPTPAPRDLTTTGDPSFQGPWTASGLPAISIPSGLSQDGLPLGIQLVGAPFEEGHLLVVARWCEQTLQVELTPPVGK